MKDKGLNKITESVHLKDHWEVELEVFGSWMEVQYVREEVMQYSRCLLVQENSNGRLRFQPDRGYSFSYGILNLKKL